MINKKEELQKQINQWTYEVNGLVKTMKKLGNKDPYNHYMVKDRIEIIKKLQAELKALEKADDNKIVEV